MQAYYPILFIAHRELAGHGPLFGHAPGHALGVVAGKLESTQFGLVRYNRHNGVVLMSKWFKSET